MSVAHRFRSMTDEFIALKDRVEQFNHTKSWVTVGEWKESVLRTILRRHLPAHCEPVRGFVVDDTGSSRQIDLLLYDNRMPVLFRDGDLVFVTADAVLGVIEVKSTIDTVAKLKNDVSKLAMNVEFVRQRGNPKVLAGMFAYSSKLTWNHADAILEAVDQAAKKKMNRTVNFVTLGQDLFQRFWFSNPDKTEIDNSYLTWHIYDLKRMSPAYFVNNVLAECAFESVVLNLKSWFPPAGKEQAPRKKRPITLT